MTAKAPSVLKLTPAEIPDPPPDRGRLLDAEGVAAEILGGLVTPRWVTRNVTVGKVKIGHVKRGWFEKDVRAWLELQREEN